MQRALSTLLALLSGCSRGAFDGSGELRNAIPVAILVQSGCGKVTGDAPAVEATVAHGAVHVVDHHAGFRCSQAVHALVRRDRNAIDVVIQPLDMDPKSISKCDCHYELAFDVESVPKGTYSLSVYHRADHRADSDRPVRVASVSVAVP